METERVSIVVGSLNLVMAQTFNRSCSFESGSPEVRSAYMYLYRLLGRLEDPQECSRVREYCRSPVTNTTE